MGAPTRHRRAEPGSARVADRSGSAKSMRRRRACAHPSGCQTASAGLWASAGLAVTTRNRTGPHRAAPARAWRTVASRPAVGSQNSTGVAISVAAAKSW
jgi:hypothetical protein